jgi:hypothetical protein
MKTQDTNTTNSAQEAGQDYLNAINVGDVMKDAVGDLWKVVGQHGAKIACLDEPIDQDPDLPYISLWSFEDFSRMTLVSKNDEDHSDIAE